MEEYLTIKEVAGLLKMHWRTVLNYVNKGELDALRLDKGYRVSQESVRRFASKRATKAKRQ